MGGWVGGGWGGGGGGGGGGGIDSLPPMQDGKICGGPGEKVSIPAGSGWAEEKRFNLMGVHRRTVLAESWVISSSYWLTLLT